MTGAGGAAGTSAIVDITYVNAQVYQPQGTYTELMATPVAQLGTPRSAAQRTLPPAGQSAQPATTATEQTGVYSASMIATAVCAKGPGFRSSSTRSVRGVPEAPWLFRRRHGLLRRYRERQAADISSIQKGLITAEPAVTSGLPLSDRWCSDR